MFWPTKSYKKNNKNSYPYAMASKRARDRVALQLLGLAGYIYSEEEADDFKNPPKKDNMDQDMDARTIVGHNKSAAEAKRDGDGEIVNEMQQSSNLDVLHDWLKTNEGRIAALPVKWQNHFWPQYDVHYQELAARQ